MRHKKTKREVWRRELPPQLELTFSPLCWLKLQYLLRSASTEVGGFGLAGDAKKPLYLHDLTVPRQTCTAFTIDFDQEHSSELFEELYGQGFEPVQCQRVWVHTHPGYSAEPSSTDERTFAESFSRVDWGVMFILAEGGQTYCRLKVNSPFRQESLLPMRVDWDAWSKEALEMSVELARTWAGNLERVTERKYLPPTKEKKEGWPEDEGVQAWEKDWEKWKREEERESWQRLADLEDEDDWNPALDHWQK